MKKATDFSPEHGIFFRSYEFFIVIVNPVILCKYIVFNAFLIKDGLRTQIRNGSNFLFNKMSIQFHSSLLYLFYILCKTTEALRLFCLFKLVVFMAFCTLT